MKNQICYGIAFTVFAAMSLAPAQQVDAQVKVSEEEKKWIDLGAMAAKKIPYIGQFMSPIVGILFEEPDRVDELRKELKAYVDTEVLAQDERAKNDILARYKIHLLTLHEFAGSETDLVPLLRTFEADIAGNFDIFMSKNKQKATRNLIFMSAQAQIHLRILDQLAVVLPDDEIRMKRDARLWKKYKDYATSQIEKVVEERLARIYRQTETMQQSGNRGRPGPTYQMFICFKDDATGWTSKLTKEFEDHKVEIEKDLRLYWKRHLLDPINYEKEHFALIQLALGVKTVENDTADDNPNMARRRAKRERLNPGRLGDAQFKLNASRRNALDFLDKNKDNRLHFSEIPRRILSEEQFASLKKHDVNKDGYLDAGSERMDGDLNKGHVGELYDFLANDAGPYYWYGTSKNVFSEATRKIIDGRSFAK